MSSYIYIRGGKSLYEFIHVNLVLPELSGLKKFMNKELSAIKENILRFDELHQYLAAHEYPMEVHIFEDGSRITSKVEYCPDDNTLVGLIAPFNQRTGLPFINFHKANSAKNIFNSITKYEKANYIQVILAQPNVPGAKTFLLGAYFTNNTFTELDVSNRLTYIIEEFSNYDIKLLGFGSDGDIRLFNVQKKLIQFGEVSRFGMIELCGNLMAENLGTQDTFHILKRFKNLMNDFARVMQIGNHIISVNHLIIMYKKFDKSLHGIVQSDLDVTDFMNYDCIYKITNERVLNLLRTMDSTQGTVIYLELIQCGLKAFVEHNTSISERLFNAVYLISILRFWKQNVIKKKLKSESFITSSCYEGLEMNLLWLIRLILDKRANNISENSSQQCESEFRHIRSLTGVQSTQINCSPKIFLSRLHKIELCERIMFELKNDISFPIIEEREERHRRENEDIDRTEIDIIIESGIFAATEKAKEVGVYYEEMSLNDLLKSSSRRNKNQTSPLNSQFVTSQAILESDDEDCELIDENLIFQNVEFLGTRSSNGCLTIKEGDTTRVVRKDQLVWMLENNKIHVNTDVRQRFVPRRTIQITAEENRAEDYWIATKVSKGDFIVLCHEGNVVFGRVLNFKRLLQSSKRKSIFYRDSIEIANCQNIGVLLSPLYFIVSGQKIEMNLIKYYKLNLYKCHVSMDVDFTKENISNYIH